MKKGHNVTNTTNNDHIHENGEVTLQLHILYGILELYLQNIFIV